MDHGPADLGLMCFSLEVGSDRLEAIVSLLSEILLRCMGESEFRRESSESGGDFSFHVL